MTEQNTPTSKKFGSVEIPLDWKVDPEDRYAQTSKEKALDFFNEKDWEPTILSMAAISIRNGLRPVFFVTGGFGSYFWASAKEVIIQEIKSSDQMQSDFSGDIPEGKFFIKRLNSL